MAAKLKRGRLSKAESEYIAANADTATVQEIAKHLRRSEDFVRQQIAALPTVAVNEERNDWVARLHASPFWVETRKGLMGGEVGFFESAWASYMDQFSSATDILATDELMIKDLVMLDIFSQRSINEQANITRRVEELEKLIDKEEALPDDQRDQLELARWHTQRNSLVAAKTTVAKQHLDCQARKDAKLRDLKGSRDQRFKQIEESRRNIFELIKDLDTTKRRKEEGRIAAKVALAAERIAEDWNEYMEFDDGEVDKPYVTPEGEAKDGQRPSERLQDEPEQANRQEDVDNGGGIQRAGETTANVA